MFIIYSRTVFHSFNHQTGSHTWQRLKLPCFDSWFSQSTIPSADDFPTKIVKNQPCFILTGDFPVGWCRSNPTSARTIQRTPLGFEVIRGPNSFSSSLADHLMMRGKNKCHKPPMNLGMVNIIPHMKMVMTGGWLIIGFIVLPTWYSQLFALPAWEADSSSQVVGWHRVDLDSSLEALGLVYLEDDLTNRSS